MKFLILVIDDLSMSGNAEEMAQIDKFNAKLEADGYWITAAGLVDPKQSLLIDNRDGLGQIFEQSLFSAKEHYSGFWLISAPSQDAARKLALDGSKACNRKVELRKLIG